ncbi:MAG: hypothetical protein ACREBU_21170, partial [Nitrososphaera sp.]
QHSAENKKRHLYYSKMKDILEGLSGPMGFLMELKLKCLTRIAPGRALHAAHAAACPRSSSAAGGDLNR